MIRGQDRLIRLRAVRQLIENVSRRDLQIALAAVAEVNTALHEQEAAHADAALSARTALAAADRGEWLFADAQAEVAGWNRQRLNVLLPERMSEVARAMENFLETRREHAQVRQLIEAARQAAKIEDDRKAQAITDDWYLSRRARTRE